MQKSNSFITLIRYFGLFNYNSPIVEKTYAVNADQRKESHGEILRKLIDKSTSKLWGKRANESGVEKFREGFKDYILTKEMEEENIEDRFFILNFAVSSYFLYADDCLRSGREPNMKTLEIRLNRNRPNL
ncbi:MAG: hypothetical protein Q7S27_05970 [Nanoarchaeota archaeon]|nr:hypothetical protein [Nanoarchaeota archaeon]